MMEKDPVPIRFRSCLVLCFVLLVFSFSMAAVSAETGSWAEPIVHQDFNEGTGILALDSSGHGSTGTIVGATRIDSGGCGRALRFNGNGSYVTIPYSSSNHPVDAITVSTWFYVDSFDAQTLVSTYRDGGYQLGFGDGNDLWWVINTEKSGLVTVPVQHEGITPGQWHHVTGTYDGETAKIYLDGALRNRVNATGDIHYEYANYVLLGADAGTQTFPDTVSPRYLKGGLDEVRIYDTALGYSQAMDDRFLCSAEPGTLHAAPANTTATFPGIVSGSVQLNNGETATRTYVFPDKTTNGTVQVSVPAGSKLVVGARDLFSSSYPDAWYVEIADGTKRVDRSIAFPNTHNTPVEGVIPSGNATVYLRYFDGEYRFPASVEVVFQCIAAPPSPPIDIPKTLLVNPSIVIYSASWATLIAILVVAIWIHRRKSANHQQEPAPAGSNETGETPGNGEKSEEKD